METMFVRHTLLHSCTAEKTIHRAWGRWGQRWVTVSPCTWPKVGHAYFNEHRTVALSLEKIPREKGLGKAHPKGGPEDPRVPLPSANYGPRTAHSHKKAEGSICWWHPVQKQGALSPWGNSSFCPLSQQGPRGWATKGTPRDGYPDGPW